MIRVFLIISLAVASTISAQEPKPPTRKQAQAEFDKADRDLNEAWLAAKKGLPESEFAALKEEQRAWVESRDYLALYPGYSGAPADEVKAKKSTEYLSAAAGITKSRTKWLKGLLRKEDDSLTGVWTDSYGGRIELVEQEGHLHFLISVVRGPTSHVGDLCGIANWNSTIGWFSDKGRDKEKTDETNLAFVRRNKKLEIIGANTGYYHGARAYFDEKYVKVETLDPKTQAKILKAAKTGEIPEE